ncbi:MAG: GAF domain-containing protein, partial [Phycisphaerales bacterium]|nr:GAF domain-containing protein [Phycisphaerales bacterium]
MPKEIDRDRSELLEIELATLFAVSQVLSQSSPLKEMLLRVLQILHDQGELLRGMVSLLDPSSGDLLVSAVHGQVTPSQNEEPVRYLPGEGLLGMVLDRGEQVILPRIGDEPRFLNRLHLYDRELPFIGVPIRAGPGYYSGVLAAQPPCHDQWLPDRARFLEMVANLIAHNVRAALDTERERGALTAERDS